MISVLRSTLFLEVVPEQNAGWGTARRDVPHPISRFTYRQRRTVSLEE